MPIYEYQCEKCGNHFEQLHKTGATVDVACPICGATEVEKQLSSFSSTGSSSTTACHSGG